MMSFELASPWIEEWLGLRQAAGTAGSNPESNRRRRLPTIGRYRVSLRSEGRALLRGSNGTCWWVEPRSRASGPAGQPMPKDSGILALLVPLEARPLGREGNRHALDSRDWAGRLACADLGSRLEEAELSASGHRFPTSRARTPSLQGRPRPAIRTTRMRRSNHFHVARDFPQNC
jgi:hypothetical protein